MDTDAIKIRLKSVLKEKGVSVCALAKRTSNLQKTLNEQINGDVKVGIAAISAILDTFQDVSAEWLLRGVGNMYGGAGENIYVNASGDHIEGVGGDVTNRSVINNSTDAALKVENDYLKQAVDELKKDKDSLLKLLMAKTNLVSAVCTPSDHGTNVHINK